MSSSSLQQVLLPCTGCNGFLRHENSISTPTLGRARSTRRCLLLRFSVHSQLHYIHQRHLQYTALLLPRAHTVETDAVPESRSWQLPMKGTRISNIRRQRKHSGLRTNEICHG